MGFKLDRVHVWAGEVADRAGGAAAALKALAEADANLEFVFTHRQPNKPVTGATKRMPVPGLLGWRCVKTNSRLASASASALSFAAVPPARSTTSPAQT